MIENAYEPFIGSYLLMLSRNSVLLRPRVSVPQSFEAKPANATPLKNWPARAPSPADVRVASALPLLLISDFGASASLPEVGWKPISALNTNENMSFSGSLPRMPTFDWLRPFEATVVIDLLLLEPIMYCSVG